MTKTHLLGAGVTLALVLTATGASAQVLNAPSPAERPNADATSAPQADSRRVMVVRDEWSGGFRSPIAGDRGIGVASIADFMAANQTEADFDRVLQGNQGVCQETGSYIRESIAIMAEAGQIDADLVSLAEELVQLGDQQNRVSWWRRGLNVVSGVFLCALGSPKYCASALSSLAGSEISSTAHDRAMRHNRDASEINNRQSRLQLRATLLTMRMNIGWSKMIHGYCLQYHPEATLGNDATA